MRFKGIKIGKSKDKHEEVIEEGNDAATPVAETKNQEEESRPKPHGPLGELSVGPEDGLMDVDFNDDAAAGSLTEGSEEEVKLVEVGAEVTAPAEAKAEAKPEDASDSFTSLFSNDEEEENPLANLINSLPDISVGELLSDLNEIKGIMEEGH
jgi:hypothetical protein